MHSSTKPDNKNNEEMKQIMINSLIKCNESLMKHIKSNSLKKSQGKYNPKETQIFNEMNRSHKKVIIEIPHIQEELDNNKVLFTKDITTEVLKKKLNTNHREYFNHLPCK